MRRIILIAHNLRSSHNVGSLLRTAEGRGVKKVYLTGYTPYPRMSADSRLPHLADKIDRQIHKTALGAEASLAWEHADTIEVVIRDMKANGYVVTALEQTDDAIPLHRYQPPDKVAILIGSEVSGIDPELLAHCTQHVMIPMFGNKESFNVVQAAAMALFYLRFQA
jgi:tRNA G18 (ribose-2'-O)-methylase SpoU